VLFQQIFSLLQDLPGDERLKAADLSRLFPVVANHRQSLR
jgi:hypothetical protein